MLVVVQSQVRSLCGNVVDISVVAQRQFPLVLELHFVDEDVGIPVVAQC